MPTFMPAQNLGGHKGGTPACRIFCQIPPPQHTNFHHKHYGDVGLPYIPSVRPSLHDPHHCITAIVAPTMTSSISHLQKVAPGEGQPQIDNLLCHREFYPRETHPVLPPNESKAATAMQHPTSLASCWGVESLAKRDVHSSADSPPTEASSVPATPTGALPMGGDSLVTLLIQMQAYVATIAADAAAATMAAVPPTAKRHTSNCCRPPTLGRIAPQAHHPSQGNQLHHHSSSTSNTYRQI